ncbi:hypothetical protein EFP00_06605 [Lactiplantibacillus paraplantarum]|uniref:hypothetical protein n=1 Tax=Lactiplantibacillus paraplantarum TaxID=60520 RepID=UPI0021A5D916|nr:hypothetical protein [Lactiplantibacillus paraplantarum]MCT4457105.1 hypothetical protein [Lactiplantibacillus paraplantarum]
MAVSDSQARASKKYDTKHPEQARQRKAKSAARSFIRNRATLDDLKELEELINERRSSLK